jgi:hypothetical protein
MNFETYSFKIIFHIIPVSRDTYRLIIPHHMFTAKTTLRPNMVALCKSVIADDISLVQAILHHIKITSKNVFKNTMLYC